MVDDLAVDLGNLGLQDEDVVIADEEMAERDARRALGFMPKYEASTPWRQFETQFENWRVLNVINNQGVEFQKRALFMALTGAAADRA